MPNHPIIQSSDHQRYMSVALALSRTNLGQTWPNPSVGAVIVKDNKIIGEGATARGGRPHAETQALAQAGEHAKGATMFVTLEPCSHQGQTPPCTEAIIRSGIETMIIACRDPNPKVNGRGIEQLKNAGIKIIEGVCEQEARNINRGFFSVIEKNRPFIAMKIATSSDGKIAAAPGVRTDITGSDARLHSQQLRAEFDAILTGIGTVLADDPLLTVRIPGQEQRSPVRIVLDRQNRLPKDSQLMKTAKDVPLWVMSEPLEEMMHKLAEKGITRLLVEAGNKLNTAFLQSGRVDRIYWYKSPIVMGDGGLSAFNVPFPPMQWLDSALFSPDILEIYENIAAKGRK